MRANVPYIYPLSEVRQKLGDLVRDMAAGEHGPVIIGPNANPRAVIVSWALFDHVRDLLSELEVLHAVPQLRERLAHPSGTATAPLGALAPTSASTTPVRFWPDVVADLRTATSAELVLALERIVTGELAGQGLADERLPGRWSWFLVTLPAAGTALAGAHYVVWRELDDETELVAVLPAGEPVARTWQPAPDPHDGAAVGSGQTS